MIDLTPLDVRKKRDDFKRAVRGYDSVQVDAFLDVVADRLEQLVREHGSLSDRVGHLESQLQTYQERERALNEALLAAQELREEARSQAERDAAVRLREAETHAEAILLDADQAIRHSQRRLEDLRARRRHFIKSLRSLMDRFEEFVDLEETRLESEPEDLGDLLERLDADLEPVPDAAVPSPGSAEVTAPGTEAAEFSAAVVGDAGREDAAAASGAPDAPGAAPAARNGQTVDPAGPIDPAEGSTDEAAGAPIATPPPTIDSGKAGAAES